MCSLQMVQNWWNFEEEIPHTPISPKSTPQYYQNAPGFLLPLLIYQLPHRRLIDDI